MTDGERRRRIKSSFESERRKLHAMGPWEIFRYSRGWPWWGRGGRVRWVATAFVRRCAEAGRRLANASRMARERGLYYAWIALWLPSRGDEDE